MLSRWEVEQFAGALAFLDGVQPLKSLNRRRTSYGWKHVAERWHKARGNPCYVSNGMFIAAALARGFRIERLPSDPNVYLNIPETLAREASG